MKNKIPTTIDQQITRMRVRGFEIHSTKEREVRKFLSDVGYYRISGFFLPYYDRNNEKLLKKIDFTKMMDTYWFDKELKSILLYLISSIEVEYKSRIANNLCLKYGPYFYCDEKFFNNVDLHNKWIEKFKEGLQYSDRDDDLFKEWYKTKYKGEFPLWVVFQLININELSKFYDLLTTSMKKELREEFNNSDIDYTKSWLRSMTVIRNIAAHNGRLFYRTINTSPKLPKPYKERHINIKRCFAVIVAMKNLCTDKNIWEHFFSDLINLITKYPEVDLIHYGFPNKWYDYLNE